MVFAFDQKAQLREDSEALGRAELGAQYLAGYARNTDNDIVAADRIDKEAVILGNYKQLFLALSSTDNPEE